ncbi:tRNA (adenosine(37)-N6)-threonylcarbamoyltransferase complex dimerization subunit type 1 TsaB [Clostridium ganghwense]|uniref:tRNA (Adenosine(37)-N6)-threonylcarbamoyltransferase complex dimerization subunit type 1 TsaB n=1 Tax=Clostridium ganghwense TaxID=312089 RepID=A0ABT4CL69_9CLOT|nr:tRNA (adenosine(37)-N6)-threonylcarbamoyltransferase complex dimerization subunit type 1 TsaB [Clostridium ganghwense]MCY6369789.1 tRNA (adenosine(37)-N6)-threonylcarbamoyltransferase complex dimerization subunit type 1 TsaB [Clostridium ganghwense]
MKILSLDSSTASATCAVIEDNKLLGEITFNDKKQHSVILMPQIDSLLKTLKLELKDIDGFVVSKGPGSFTGLRIGIATVKGFAQGTNKPFIGISTLDALAYNLAYTSGIICPIMDALRDNVYTALYKFNNGKLEQLTDYMAIHIDELVSIIKEYTPSNITFIGDAIPKFKEKLNESFENTYFAPAHLNVAKAASLGELGLLKLKEGENDNLLSFAPIYLKKSQAEREYESRTGMSIDE